MDDDLDISLAILGLDDPEGAQRALETLAQTDPARAQQISQRLQFRQEALGLFRQAGDAATDTLNSLLRPAQVTANAIGSLIDVFSSENVDNALGSIGATPEDQAPIPSLGQGVGEAIGQSAIDGDLRGNLPLIPGIPATSANAISGADQLISDLLFPESQLQSAVAQTQLPTPELDAALGSVQPSQFLPAAQSGVPTGVANQLPNSVPPAGSLNLDPRIQAVQQLQAAEQARNALAIDSARQAAASQVNQINLSRLGDQIALQQVPQVSTNLNAAVAFAQTPAIDAAPANFAQSLPLTQAVAPQVTIPDLAPTARANIRQRNQTERLTQSTQERLQREQLRALELARQTFATTIARPILSERR